MTELTYEQRVELLSDLYAGAEQPDELRWSLARGGYYAQMAGSYVWMVAKYTPAHTMYDILRAEDELDEHGEIHMDGEEIRLLRFIVELWQDGAALRESGANLLTMPGSGASFEDNLRYQLAHTLRQEGTIVDDGASFYGWKDWDYNFGAKKSPVAAVRRVWEDYWSEFRGTFTDESHHHGLTGEVVLEDGTVHLMRFETDLGDMLRKVLRNAPASVS